jgi:1-acyl-sn-glycerol-3-phosphate acyltransferase
MRTIFTGLAVAVMTILLAPTAALARLLRLPRSVPQWCMRTWARGICAASGTRVVLHGAEHAARDRGVVYASNHVSWFDVFALASVLPQYTFVAKAELRKIPIFGWGAEAAGVVFLARENRKSAFEAYHEVAGEVSRGLSVVVYPEGTRGFSYSLRPFKKGPFVLAIAAKAPVVPVLVHGAREVLPKGGWRVTAGTIHVHLLEPVEAASYDYESRHDLMRAVWERIAECMRSEYSVHTSEHPIATSRMDLSA